MMTEVTNNADRYNAEENLYAGYLSFEIPFKKFRLIAGARYEQDQQQLEGFDRTSLAPKPINVDVKTNDVLPGLNLTYFVNENTNLRFSASQTVSRPELRELAPFGYVDFVTDGDVSGNPDLKSCLIQNYDVRYEVFPAAGEIFSVSAFYKHFNRPIERVIVPTITTPAPAYTFENAEDGAVNYGVELEVRKNLGFLSKNLTNFLINGNIAFINSQVDLQGTSSASTETKRRLQGQAPYTINLGLYYDNFNLGTSINFLYNRSGDRISEVGRRGFNDVYEKGRDIFDLSATQRIFQNFEMKFAIKDILNQDERYTQQVTLNPTSSELVEKDVRLVKSGTTYSLTLGYKF
jgi:TonB-dependent receptor